MKLVFNVIIKWLELFPTNLVQNYEYTKKYPKLYLVDFTTALSKCGSEFIDILSKCFGICSRCKQLFYRFQGVYLYKGSFEMAPYMSQAENVQIDPTERNNKDSIICSFFNLFCSMGGLDAFQFFISGGQSRGEFFSYEPSDYYTIPIPYMYKILQAFSDVYFYLNESKMNEILN